MLSTLSILIIFVEIFTAGILLTGSYIFAKRSFEESNKTFLLLGGVFAFFGVYIAAILTAQLVYNIALSPATIYLSHKIISAALVTAALFVYMFCAEKNYIRPKWISVLFVGAAGVLVIMAFASQPDMLCQKNLSLPALESSSILSIKVFWLLSWILLGTGFLTSALKASDPREKRLAGLSGFSSIGMVAGYSIYLICPALRGEMATLTAWIILLVSSSGLLLGNIISPNDDIALHPISYLKTRILIKLVMIFVLMIVLIVEATTLATIAIARNSLEKSIKETNKSIGAAIVYRISHFRQQTSDRTKLIEMTKSYVEDFGRLQNRSVLITDTSKRTVIYYNNENKAFGPTEPTKTVGTLEIVPELQWTVLVSQPMGTAYAEIRKVETNSLIFVIIGILVAVIVGVFFSKNIENSINAVIIGTEEIRRGNLNFEIKTSSEDEIGRLAREFNLMTAELKESQDHLIASEKLAALGTMAAGMAHEIKNPLVAMRTFTQLLPLKWEDKEFRDKFIAIIPPEIDKINKIAENLLKFGRPSKPEFKNITIDAVLEEVLELLENQIKKNNVRVSTKFVKTPKISADPNQLSQAFLNIIMNAAQAMKDGGELIVKTDIGHVIQLGKITKEGFISAKKLADKPAGEKVPMVFVEITDTGPGIPEESMRNMFDPFFTTKESGTGMGLPITLRIIEDHKGSIKVRSQVGKGTTFIIMLPPAEKIEEDKNTAEG